MQEVPSNPNTNLRVAKIANFDALTFSLNPKFTPMNPQPRSDQVQPPNQTDQHALQTEANAGGPVQIKRKPTRGDQIANFRCQQPKP
jgi:hypothetical protein